MKCIGPSRISGEYASQKLAGLVCVFAYLILAVRRVMTWRDERSVTAKGAKNPPETISH